MKHTNSVLWVENVAQAALMLELDGQISDGFWEGARPSEHWRPWCQADVRVAEAGQPTGRTFYAPRDTYNFTAKALLDVVAPRMLAYVRLALRYGLEVAAALEHAPDCTDGRLAHSAYIRTCIRDAARLLGREADDAFVNELNDVATNPFGYTVKDLRRDLTALKRIARTKVR